MNTFTLSIRDPLIQQTFNENRAKKFEQLFFPMAFLVIGLVLVRLILYFSKTKAEENQGEWGSVLQTAIFLIWLLVWKLMTWCCKLWAPICVYFPAILYAIVQNLQMRNWLPVAFHNSSIEHAEQEMIVYLLICFLANYNSFYVGFLFMTPLICCNYIYIMLQLSEDHLNFN